MDSLRETKSSTNSSRGPMVPPNAISKNVSHCLKGNTPGTASGKMSDIKFEGIRINFL